MSNLIIYSNRSNSSHVCEKNHVPNPTLKELHKFYQQQRKNQPIWKLKCYNFEYRILKDNICRFCILVKPERTVHCKICKKCVRKIDHHCFLINNCIGIRNYKLFMNLLIYSSLNAFIIIIFMGIYLVNLIENYSVNIIFKLGRNIFLYLFNEFTWDGFYFFSYFLLFVLSF